MDQCPVLPGGAMKILFVIAPLVVVINLHFAMVLYTHWKRAPLGKSQGGTYDEW